MKIFLDAGHNFEGADTGATGNGLREQDITYKISSKLKPLLERHGHTVKLSRNSLTESLANTAVSASLSARTRMANDWNADLFVSIHCNAGGGTGTETFSYEGGISSGYKLAQAVQSSIVSEIGLTDRGVKINSGLYVLRNTNMPAILVETAFIDHKKDAFVLGSDAGQNSFAIGIAKGICKYLNTEYIDKGGDTMGNYEYETLSQSLDDLTETVKILATELNDLKHPTIYNYIDKNMPQWAIPTVKKLCDKGYLKGDTNGLNLDESLLRMLVINDRAGVYGE